MHVLYCQIIRNACIQGEIYFGLNPPTEMRDKVLGHDCGLNGVQKVFLKQVPVFSEITNVRPVSRVISSYLLFDVCEKESRAIVQRNLVVFTQLPQLHNPMMIVLAGQFAAQEAVRKITNQVSWDHAYGMFKFTLFIVAESGVLPEIPAIVAGGEYGYCSELILDATMPHKSPAKLTGPDFDIYLDQPCFCNITAITILMQEKCPQGRRLGERLIARYNLTVIRDEAIINPKRQLRPLLRRTLSAE